MYALKNGIKSYIDVVNKVVVVKSCWTKALLNMS